ncbi:MAG: BT4734/BF3469 family protein [Bacteroidaceae bacterium]
MKKARCIYFATEWEKADGKSVIQNFNDLILLGINRLTDEDEGKKIHDMAAQIPYTIMTFVGITGCSVKIVCQTTFPDGKQPDDDRLAFINEAYRKLFYIYSTQQKMAIDKIQPTLESSCCVSVDPAAVFSEDAFMSIKRLRSYDIKFAFLRSNVSFISL